MKVTTICIAKKFMCPVNARLQQDHCFKTQDQVLWSTCNGDNIHALILFPYNSTLFFYSGAMYTVYSTIKMIKCNASTLSYVSATLTQKLCILIYFFLIKLQCCNTQNYYTYCNLTFWIYVFAEFTVVHNTLFHCITHTPYFVQEVD